ncbi:MAG: hypothetical protein Q7T86_05705 [Hyphomicrobiaceae bacterium]|nr:hypothetical protein [Hyphomicrobiaceae bacterium]
MPAQRSTPILTLLLAAAFAIPASAVPEKPSATSGWIEIVDARSGSEISYPAAVFSEKAAEPEGRILVSADGNARLLVGSFLNESGASLDAYRTQLLQENYRGAQLDYAPVRRTWFVISGTIGAMMFYERVSFTCSGRYINSWAMLYPTAERSRYDRVVEEIAPTFRPGSGEGGRCE